MLEFRAADLDPVGDIGDAPVPVEGAEDFTPPEPDRLTKDQFWEVFQIGFAVPGQVMPPMAPLAIQAEERPQARGASDAVYRLLEIYYPAALMPAGETVALVLAAGPFFIAKAMVVRAILADQRAARAQAVNGPQNEPPEGDHPGSATPVFKSARNRPNPPEPPASGLDWMDGEAA